jgi:hypothetical protein
MRIGFLLPLSGEKRYFINYLQKGRKSGGTVLSSGFIVCTISAPGVVYVIDY